MNPVVGLILKVILISIDLTITLITFGWVKAVIKFFSPKALRTVPVADDEAHRVDPKAKGNLTTSMGPGLVTLYDLLTRSFEINADKVCIGEREFKGWKVPGKVKHFGDIQTKSFRQVCGMACKFGAALRATGLVPAPDTTTIDQVNTSCRMAIFENTCPAWIISCMGAFTQSITVTTVYTTLGMDAVVEAVIENLIPAIVCNKRDVGKLLEKAGQMKMLTHIIYTNDLVAPDETIDWPAPPAHVTVISFDDFVASGDTNKFPPTPPKPDTCAVVMYTSGSTGKPKGVILTHGQIVACCQAVKTGFGLREGQEVYLAYLPCAHILELMAEVLFPAIGCAMMYADPKSLTSSGSYPMGALEQYKPTVMAAVPKIWDIIRKGILAKIESGSPTLQFLFQVALEWRMFCQKHGFDAPLFKALVFKKVAAATGGRLTAALSGGGPLNSDTQDFVRAAFGIDFVQGYGLTETCAGLCIQARDDVRGGVAGVPLTQFEVKLVSTPDVGDKAGQPYLSTDRFDVDGKPIFGRGEICAKGTSIAVGYYMMPEKTKEDFGDDGWFHTGDIGQFLSDGSIQIIDRKKNLVKLRGGEYIALEKMEMTYGNSTFVDAVAGGICCCGDGDMDRPVALMQLSEAAAMKWAREQGISGDYATVQKSKELYQAVLEEMNKLHAKSDLSHLEKLVAVSLLTSPWTPENGCLTAANKLQRRNVVQMFDKEFGAVKARGIFN